MKKLRVIGVLATLGTLGYFWLASKPTPGERTPSETSSPSWEGDETAPSPARAPGAREDEPTVTTSTSPVREMIDVTSSVSRRQRVLPAGNVAALKAKGRALRARQLEALGISPAPANAAIATNRGSFASVANFWAIPQSAYTGGGMVVRRDVGHVFLKMETGVPLPEGAKPAVYNAEQGTFGFLSGGVMIVLRPGADALSLTRDYPLSLVPQAEDEIIFYRSNSSSRGSQAAMGAEELSQLLAQLRADVRVSAARLEVIEHGFEPK